MLLSGVDKRGKGEIVKDGSVTPRGHTGRLPRKEGSPREWHALEPPTENRRPEENLQVGQEDGPFQPLRSGKKRDRLKLRSRHKGAT